MRRDWGRVHHITTLNGVDLGVSHVPVATLAHPAAAFRGFDVLLLMSTWDQGSSALQRAGCLATQGWEWRMIALAEVGPHKFPKLKGGRPIFHKIVGDSLGFIFTTSCISERINSGNHHKFQIANFVTSTHRGSSWKPPNDGES